MHSRYSIAFRYMAGELTKKEAKNLLKIAIQRDEIKLTKMLRHELKTFEVK